MKAIYVIINVDLFITVHVGFDKFKWHQNNLSL
jgi:hypothetical protein